MRPPYELLAFVARVYMLGCVALALALTISPRQDDSSPYLNLNMTAKGKLWFGSAIDTSFSSEVSNAGYMSLFNDSRIFGGTTPINNMKWVYTEPSQNQFTLSEGQKTINLARATGKKVRCHNLIWGATALPNWVQNGAWTNASLQAVMKNHITKLITSYGTGCYSWDVVNEALNADGTFAENVFHYHIGPAYVPLAFQFANQAVQSIGGGVKLYYNEFGAEAPGAKQQAVVSLVQTIQAWTGAHIDGVGLESHFTSTAFPSPNDFASAMASYTALGIDAAVTELDVSCSVVPCTAKDLAYQAKAYYIAISTCIKNARCVGVTVWDFDDQYSWIQPSGSSTAGNPCLYYANLTRHPAYTAAAQAIYEWDCSVC